MVAALACPRPPTGASGKRGTRRTAQRREAAALAARTLPPPPLPPRAHRLPSAQPSTRAQAAPPHGQAAVHPRRRFRLPHPLFGLGREAGRCGARRPRGGARSVARGAHGGGGARRGARGDGGDDGRLCRRLVWAYGLRGGRADGSGGVRVACRDGCRPGGRRGGGRGGMGARWDGRRGLEPRVPIVPLFTRNVRELFLVLGANKCAATPRVLLHTPPLISPHPPLPPSQTLPPSRSNRLRALPWAYTYTGRATIATPLPSRRGLTPYRPPVASLQPLCCSPLVTWLYNLTKLPFTPFLGPVPLPLTSALGPQLPFDAAKSAADVANEAEEAMRGLIRTVCGLGLREFALPWGWRISFGLREARQCDRQLAGTGRDRIGTRYTAYSLDFPRPPAAPGAAAPVAW
eukprot:4685478-Prymnesium_polylepis.1